MDELPISPDQYYIRTVSSQAEQASRALKDGEMFLITDRHGDIRPFGFGDHGLYFEGTRFLSRYLLTIEGKNTLLLSSTTTQDNNFLMVDLTNPDLSLDGTGEVVRKGEIHINRWMFLWEGCCHERIRITNFGLTSVQFRFSLSYDADFVDIFEVRGMSRSQHGVPGKVSTEGDRVVLPYHGLDGITRRTRLDFSPRPDQLNAHRALFSVNLGPREDTHYFIRMATVADSDTPAVLAFDDALERAETVRRQRSAGLCSVHSSNEQFNAWINRSRSDISMMLTHMPEGPYPFAGIPWYSTVFGRDGLITAMQTLWINPDISRGVLTFLANNQAEIVDATNDAQPGKILHEMRKGEMANLGEVPFKRYYGTVDATPLFVMLAGRYYRATGNMGFLERLWPSIKRALRWIDEYGDADGDGFVEYSRATNTGLVNQGWKDSEDSVFHADGRLAEPPIALCEVQAYVYEAKRQASRLARELGKMQTAERLAQEARQLRARFYEAFWQPELGTYALALDGNKEPCRVVTSNAGHTLFTGLAAEEHAGQVVRSLMDRASFIEWGIRTVASGQARYNPMSYHNGSVWPHDNAMIAYGMAWYGYRDEAVRLLTGMYEASLHMELRRLPEVFCGFHRREGEGPTLYPVACSPQAWAAGGAFMLLQACLGMTVSGPERTVYFSYPVLPAFLDSLTIENLRVGEGKVSLVIDRRERGVTVYLIDREGDVRVTVTK